MTDAHIPAAVGGRCVPWCPACRAEEKKETAKLAPEAPKRKREPAVYRDMTCGEEDMAEALGRCKIPSGFIASPWRKKERAA